MLTNGNWSYVWNAENRLIQAVNGTTTLDFKYDYMGRRLEKKVTENSTLTKHEYFVYDGYKLIEKLDVLNGSVASQKFIWSGETLLSMNDANGTYYYLIDANKNVGQLLDSSGNIKAKYEYSPFGKLTSSSDNVDNPFRFSSEYADIETGLVYYNYRYYSPELGRWTKRDSIAERGGYNLYGLVGNDGINKWDYLGLFDCKGLKRKIDGNQKQLKSIAKRQKELAKAQLDLNWHQQANVITSSAVGVFSAGLSMFRAALSARSAATTVTGLSVTRNVVNASTRVPYTAELTTAVSRGAAATAGVKEVANTAIQEKIKSNIENASSSDSTDISNAKQVLDSVLGGGLTQDALNNLGSRLEREFDKLMQELNEDRKKYKKCCR